MLTFMRRSLGLATAVIVGSIYMGNKQQRLKELEANCPFCNIISDKSRTFDYEVAFTTSLCFCIYLYRMTISSSLPIFVQMPRSTIK